MKNRPSPPQSWLTDADSRFAAAARANPIGTALPAWRLFSHSCSFAKPATCVDAACIYIQPISSTLRASPASASDECGAAPGLAELAAGGAIIVGAPHRALRRYRAARYALAMPRFPLPTLRPPDTMSDLDSATLEALRQVSTATLTTQLFKRGLRNTFMQGVAPLAAHSGANLVGPAFTLRNIPSREDIDVLELFADPEYAQRKCVETIPAGHVLVQDCRGERGSASFGSILTQRLQVRGVAGMVSDGPVRDSTTIAALGIPVFCAGASAPPNLIRHHAVDINVPIGCGGVAVFPGDVIVGDADGVVVIPLKMAVEVAQAAAEQEQLEAFLTERIRDGAALPGTYPPNETTKAAYEAWKEKRKA
jgi:regulator of RNase E activity RraA